MKSRLELQTKLEHILGSKNVYFQPPENIKIKYPCIIYSRESSDVQHADNIKYVKHKGYQLTYVDKNPDSPIPDTIEELQTCRFDRHFVSDNLHHFVFTLYF